MKIEFPPNIALHLMGVETQWVNVVGDDDLLLVRAAVNNGDFNAKKENAVTLRLNQADLDQEAVAHGGILVLANLKKSTMRRALMLGLHLLATNGNLSADDYLGKTDGDSTQHAG